MENIAKLVIKDEIVEIYGKFKRSILDIRWCVGIYEKQFFNVLEVILKELK